MNICAAFMFFTTLLALGQRILLVWENGKLNKEYNKSMEGKKYQKGAVATEDYDPNFRHIL
jgi:hypothetical protein